MVLNGAGDYLSEMGIIYCEVHDSPIDGTVEEVQSMLENSGFKLEEIETSRGEIFLKAINNRY